MLSILLIPLGAAAQAPTVSNIQVENGSHSSLAISFAASAAVNASRVRYIPVSQGSCTSGTGGQVQNNTLWNQTSDSSYIRLDVTGLTANTQYQFCPEVSSDWGSTWSSGVGATWTTLPLPLIHPALPFAPATFDTSYPDTTAGTCWSSNQPGYCTVVEPVSGNTCPNLNSDIATAISHQMTSGTTIEVPAGSTCVGQVDWYQLAPDVIPYNPSNITNNTISLANHGLTEGQGVLFDTTESEGGTYYPGLPTNVINGYIYFVHVVDANDFQLYYPWQQETGSTTTGSNTITVSSTAGWADSTGLAVGYEVVGSGIPAGTTITAISGNNLTLSNAATATAGNITLTFGGPLWEIGPCSEFCSGNNGNAYFVEWPRPIPYWVIVRTSTPDSQFAPENTRVSPTWASKMAALQMPAMSTYGTEPWDVLFQPEMNWDTYGTMFATKLRFTGIEFTWTASTELSSDPVSHYQLVFTKPTDSNFVFDRDWFHNPGGRQDRVASAFNLQGMNIAVKDSYWDGLDYWHGTYVIPGDASADLHGTSAAPTQVSSTSFTVPSTSVYYGAANPASLPSTLTVSWSGTTTVSNPEISVYFDMNGNLITAVPSGLTATASAGTVISTTASGNGSCSEGDGVVPSDFYGREAAAPLGCAVLNGSAQISSLVAGTITASESSEGCQCVLAGVGPGPYQFSNNYISATGIPVHFDDSGGGRVRGDYLIQRNTFHTPMQHMAIHNNPNAQAAGIPSDGYDYGHRQPLEWKAGYRAQIDGNIFDGTFKEDTPNGVFFDVTPRTDGSSTDFDVTNNTFQHGPVGTSPFTPIDGNGAGTVISYVGTRYRLYNNLFWDVNGWIYSTGSQSSDNAGSGSGAILPATGGPDEDLIVDHNDFYDIQGWLPQWFNWYGYPLEGLQWTDNIISYQNGGGFGSGGTENSANCGGADEAFLNCNFPDSILKDNVIVPGWLNDGGWDANGYPPSGQLAQSTVESSFPDYVTSNYFLTSNLGVSATLGSIGFYNNVYTPGHFDANGDFLDNPDFHLLSESAYASGHTMDGKGVGVDIDALEAAQGKVTLIGVPASSITSSSATVAFVAPDLEGCSVDYSSTDPTITSNFTRVADAGGGRVRNISLTGLAGQTSYYYRVDCAVQQPTGEFRTH